MSFLESLILALFTFFITVGVGTIAGVILLLLQKHFMKGGEK